MAQNKYKEIEDRFGYPMRRILIDLYRIYQSKKLIAHELGVDDCTVQNWWMRTGLPERAWTVDWLKPKDES